MKRSKTYSFRLHPDDDYESDAMVVIETWNNVSINFRSAMTDAILHAAGRTPEMYKQDDTQLTPALMRKLFSEFKDEISDLLTSVGKIREYVDVEDSDGHAALDKVESRLLEALENRQAQKSNR